MSREVAERDLWGNRWNFGELANLFPRASLRRYSKWARFSLSVVLLLLLIRTIPFEPSEVLVALQQCEPSLLALPLLLKLLSVFVSAIRLSTLLEILEIKTSTVAIWRILMFGEAINKVVPGSVGTVAYTTYKVGGGAHTLVAQIFDKLAFLSTALLVGLCASIAIGHMPLAILCAATLGLGVIGLLAGYAFRPGILEQGGLQATIMTLVRAPVRHPGKTLRYTACAFANLALMTGGFLVLWLACHFPIPASYALACTTLVTIAIAIPLTINGIGLREWTFIATLAPLTPPPATLALVLLLSYGIGLATSLIGYFIPFLHEAFAKEEACSH